MTDPRDRSDCPPRGGPTRVLRIRRDNCNPAAAAPGGPQTPRFVRWITVFAAPAPWTATTAGIPSIS